MRFCVLVLLACGPLSSLGCEGAEPPLPIRAAVDAGQRDASMMVGPVCRTAAAPAGGTCPAMAPAPMNQMGVCCARTSNAAKQNDFALRISGVAITSPSTLNIANAVLKDALDSERFNWVIQVRNQNEIRTGYARRTAADGSFSFTTNAAPGGSNRWDPVTLPATLTDNLLKTAATAAGGVTLPVFDTMDALQLELPVFNVQVAGACLSESASCVGFTASNGAFDNSQGVLRGFLRVEDTNSTVMVASVSTKLCALVAGGIPEGILPTYCTDQPRAMWKAPPNSVCTGDTCVRGGCDTATCNAWELIVNFAAQCVELR